MEELKLAIQNIIDERLKELGLVEEESAAPPAKASGKGGKGKASAAAKKDESADEEEITEETLKAKIVSLVEKDGKDAVKAIFKKLKVEKLSDVTEKQYPKLDAALDEALGTDGGEGGEDLF